MPQLAPGDDAPDECREFFASEYPQMTDVSSHLATIEECGRELVGRFTLPESSWWEPCYGPLAERLAGYEAPSEDDETQAITVTQGTGSNRSSMIH